MLDKARLAVELERLADTLFIDNSQQVACAQQAWRVIAADPTFVYKIRSFNAPWPIPSWSGDLGSAIDVAQTIDSYQVISVDGSQIYPDRHQGVSCFLINIGSVALHYGSACSPVMFRTVPYLFSGEELYEGLAPSTEVVNCCRQELELQSGFEQACSVKKKLNSADPLLLLYDGSLIFWHLEAQDNLLKDAFLSRYLAVLLALSQEKILTASYVSLPKSRELVNLIRLHLCNFDPAQSEKFKIVDRLVDATIAGFFLKPYTRTIVFKNHAKISGLYPEQVHPHFFYLHVGNEIGRVEIPGWVAQEEQLIDLVARALLDQSIKGYGYPIAIAEAHEQAVVKGPDRDFFYHLLHKMGVERHVRPTLSRKSIKKRGIGI